MNARIEFFDADCELPHVAPRKPALYSVPDTFDAAKEIAEEDAFYAEHERKSAEAGV